MPRRIFHRKASSSSRVRNSIDTGSFLGRSSAGRGPIELLSLADIASQLVQKGFLQSGPTPHGLGFFIGGTMLDDELLGGVVFTNDMKFYDSDPAQILAQVQAQASATFHFVTGTPDVVVGSIVFGAGSKTGALTWTTNPFVLSAGTQLRLRSPNPADVSLAYVSGTIQGEIA